MASNYITNELYAAIEALGIVTQEDVIPNGETWEVHFFEGNASYLDDAHVCLVWDYEGVGETIIRATHGDTSQNLSFTCVGDGVKKLAIVLINDTNAERVIGASWRGKKVS